MRKRHVKVPDLLCGEYSPLAAKKERKYVIGLLNRKFRRLPPGEETIVSTRYYFI